MNNETQKLEILRWVSQLDDADTLQELYTIMKQKNKIHKNRSFGCGKDIVIYVAPDFNEPLPEFNDYVP